MMLQVDRDLLYLGAIRFAKLLAQIAEIFHRFDVFEGRLVKARWKRRSGNFLQHFRRWLELLDLVSVRILQP